MPEGHTLHRLAGALDGAFAGGTPHVTSPQGRFAEGAALLDGTLLERSWAHGKLLFVDFAGDTIGVVDPASGEVWQAKLFVACMGASSLIFAEARASEGLADWLGAHVSLFTALGGVPKFVVCDNLKAAVTNPDRHGRGTASTG